VAALLLLRKNGGENGGGGNGGNGGNGGGNGYDVIIGPDGPPGEIEPALPGESPEDRLDRIEDQWGDIGSLPETGPEWSRQPGAGANPFRDELLAKWYELADMYEAITARTMTTAEAIEQKLRDAAAGRLTPYERIYNLAAFDESKLLPQIMYFCPWDTAYCKQTAAAWDRARAKLAGNLTDAQRAQAAIYLIAAQMTVLQKQIMFNYAIFGPRAVANWSAQTATL